MLRGSWSYNSKTYNDDINSVYLTQGAFSLFDAQVAFESEDGKWDFVVWGKNLSDKRYIFSGDANEAAGFVQGNYSPPRSYGATLRRRF